MMRVGHIEDAAPSATRLKTPRRSLVIGALVVMRPQPSTANDLFRRHRVSPHASLEVPQNWRLTSEFNADFDASVRERQRASGLPPGDPSSVTFSAGRYLDSGQALAWTNVRIYPQESITNAEIASAPDAEIAKFDQELQAGAFRGARAAQFSIVSWAGTARWQHSGVAFLVSAYERSPLVGANHTRGSNVVVRLIRLLDSARSLTLTVAHAKSGDYIMRPIVDRIALSLHVAR